MKKVLKGVFFENGQKYRITATVTDERGHISITGEIFRPHEHISTWCGCVHEEIKKAFPKLAKFIPLHVVSSDINLPLWAYENAAYFLANNEPEKAQNILNCTDSELRELVAMVDYGLCKTKRFGSYSIGKDSQILFNNLCDNLGIRARFENLKSEFYTYLESI